MAERRPVALVTGVGRRRGIAAAIVERLAIAGWDVAFTFWRPSDDRMAWGRDDHAAAALGDRLPEVGARAFAVEADLADVDSAKAIFDSVVDALGDVRALVMSHAESVDSDIRSTTVESFDRHFAVNARASWLLIREFAVRFREPYGTGRIVALTSDHTAGNLPYGASKGALDRITLAAARELRDLGVTANVVNPGPVDTGWMTDDLVAACVSATPLGRLGTPLDCANLVAFLCSSDGGWINGQLIHSNGGFA